MVVGSKPNLILIADDDAAILSIIENVFQAEGYDVISVNNGRECITQLNIHTPDLLILDIKMPEMNGIDVCRYVKHNPLTKHIPVLFITGMYDYNSRINGKKAGGDEFLYKPFDVAELLFLAKNLIKIKQNYETNKFDHDTIKQRLKQTSTELQSAQEETVIRLSYAAECKDLDTGKHLSQMSKYVELVAKALGFDQHIAQMIGKASLCHDIGKIGVPENILSKPGPLDDHEWVIMKEHTTIGARILANSNSMILQTAELIALSHHENWDGSGYPMKLSREDIPIEARIVRIADVFDALTSKRVYKEPYSIEDSLNIIASSKGVEFDPDVYDAFMSVLDEILDLKKNALNNTLSHVFYSYLAG